MQDDFNELERHRKDVDKAHSKWSAIIMLLIMSPMIIVLFAVIVDYISRLYNLIF